MGTLILKIALGLGLGGGLGAGLGYMTKCSSGACPFTATPWRGAFFGALMGLVVSMAIGSGCGAPSGAKRAQTPPADVKKSEGAGPAAAAASPRRIASAEDFKENVEGAKGLVFVDFYADWCSWCHKLAPVVDKLAADYDGKVTFVKVDTEALQDVAGRFGVRGLPTMIVFKGGQPAETIVGYRDEAALKEILDKLLAAK
jgi:thioredoxin 1